MSWSDFERTANAAESPAYDEDSSASAPHSPNVALLPASMMHVYGPMPLADPDRDSQGRRLMQCNVCLKPILECAVEEHRATCLKAQAKPKLDPISRGTPPLVSLVNGGAKKRRLSDASIASTANGSGTPKKKWTAKEKRALAAAEAGLKLDDGMDSPGSGKVKVKAEGEDEPKKVKKKTGGIKMGRNKGPVDVDRQCGVINEKGLPCSRSLTCKSHSMGAKRSVAGRSRAYDELLHDWQVIHNPNFVARKPVVPRVGPGIEPGNKKKKKKDREKGESSAAVGKSANAWGTEDANNMVIGEVDDDEFAGGYGDETIPGGWAEAEMLDSDDEMEQVLLGLNRVQARSTIVRPLAMCKDDSIFVVHDAKFSRIKESLLTALNGPKQQSQNSSLTVLGMPTALQSALGGGPVKKVAGVPIAAKG